MEKQIKKYLENPVLYLEKISDDQLSKIILYCAKKYYNEDAVINDDEYDFLVDELKKRNPNHPTLKKIGAPLPKVSEIKKVKLPYHMGSMDKFKLSDIKQLNNWISKFKGSYTLTDKLDGVSALYYLKDNKASLFKRGEEKMGSDVSFLIPYIPSLNNLKLNSNIKELAVRGELIISLDNFDNYSGDKTNPRAMVAGLTNKKTLNPADIKLIDFVAYEMIFPRNKHSEQLSKISDYGFKTVHSKILKSINFDILIGHLRDRKETSKYEVDGIIITDDNYHEVNDDGNPEYSFAFKELPEKNTANAKVIEVEWNISKDGYIKPTVLIEDVKLSGVTIKRCTGFNGKFIKDGKIGKGAIIEITRSGDVIPHILKVIKPTQADMPDFPYKWNDTNVDIMVDDKKNKSKQVVREQKISELTYFVTHMNIKFLNEQTVVKLYDAGYEEIVDILGLKKDNLLELDNFKDKMAEKIYDSIQSAIEEMDIVIFANASNIFGRNFGSKRLKAIFEKYPKIFTFIKNKTKEEITNKIKEIDGFEETMASQFAEKIIEYEKLVKKLPKNLQDRVSEYEVEEVVEDKLISDKTFVFSGFRNKEWEEYIESRGGKISGSVSGKTDYLVTTKEEKEEATNSKVKKAIELNKTVLTKEEFQKKYIK